MIGNLLFAAGSLLYSDLAGDANTPIWKRYRLRDDPAHDFIHYDESETSRLNYLTFSTFTVTSVKLAEVYAT
ncbi:hypothetical protein ACNKHK_27295 [Shigella flexneri]